MRVLRGAGVHGERLSGLECLDRDGLPTGSDDHVVAIGVVSGGSAFLGVVLIRAVDPGAGLVGAVPLQRCGIG